MMPISFSLICATAPHAATRFLRACAVAGLLLAMGFTSAAWAQDYGSTGGGQDPLKALRRDINQTMAQPAAGSNILAPVQPISSQPVSQGSTAVMETLMRGIVNQQIAQHNAYLEALKADGMPVLLDPDRIGHDKGLRQSLVILQAVKKDIEKYHALSDQSTVLNRSSILRLDLSDDKKQALLTGYDKGQAEVRPFKNQMWRLETKAATDADALITFLQMHHGHWQVRDHRILLDSAALLTEFTPLVEAIQDDAQAERMLQQRGRKEFNSMAESAGH